MGIEKISEEVQRPISPGADQDAILQAVGDEIREKGCLLYTSPSPRDKHRSRMPSSA